MPNKISQEGAATRLQARFRGNQSREDLKKKTAAATRLQARFRGDQSRDDLKNKTEAVTRLQARFRGNQTRAEVIVKRLPKKMKQYQGSIGITLQDQNFFECQADVKLSRSDDPAKVLKTFALLEKYKLDEQVTGVLQRMNELLDPVVAKINQKRNRDEVSMEPEYQKKSVGLLGLEKFMEWCEGIHTVRKKGEVTEMTKKDLEQKLVELSSAKTLADMYALAAHKPQSVGIEGGKHVNGVDFAEVTANQDKKGALDFLGQYLPPKIFGILHDAVKNGKTESLDLSKKSENKTLLHFIGVGGGSDVVNAALTALQVQKMLSIVGITLDCMPEMRIGNAGELHQRPTTVGHFCAGDPAAISQYIRRDVTAADLAFLFNGRIEDIQNKQGELKKALDQTQALEQTQDNKEKVENLTQEIEQLDRLISLKRKVNEDLEKSPNLREVYCDNKSGNRHDEVLMPDWISNLTFVSQMSERLVEAALSDDPKEQAWVTHMKETYKLPSLWQDLNKEADSASSEMIEGLCTDMQGEIRSLEDKVSFATQEIMDKPHQEVEGMLNEKNTELDKANKEDPKDNEKIKSLSWDKHCLSLILRLTRLQDKDKEVRRKDMQIAIVEREYWGSLQYADVIMDVVGKKAGQFCLDLTSIIKETPTYHGVKSSYEKNSLTRYCAFSKEGAACQKDVTPAIYVLNKRSTPANVILQEGLVANVCGDYPKDHVGVIGKDTGGDVASRGDLISMLKDPRKSIGERDLVGKLMLLKLKSEGVSTSIGITAPGSDQSDSPANILLDFLKENLPTEKGHIQTQGTAILVSNCFSSDDQQNLVDMYQDTIPSRAGVFDLAQLTQKSFKKDDETGAYIDDKIVLLESLGIPVKIEADPYFGDDVRVAPDASRKEKYDTQRNAKAPSSPTAMFELVAKLECPLELMEILNRIAEPEEAPEPEPEPEPAKREVRGKEVVEAVAAAAAAAAAAEAEATEASLARITALEKKPA